MQSSFHFFIPVEWTSCLPRRLDAMGMNRRTDSAVLKWTDTPLPYLLQLLALLACPAAVIKDTPHSQHPSYPTARAICVHTQIDSLKSTVTLWVFLCYGHHHHNWDWLRMLLTWIVKCPFQGNRRRRQEMHWTSKTRHNHETKIVNINKEGKKWII